MMMNPKKLLNPNRLVDFLIRRAVWVFLVAILLALVGGQLTRQLRIQTDLAELLPDSFQSVRTLHEIRDKVGSVTTLRVLVEGTDFEAMKAYADTLAATISQSPLVALVDYKRDLEFFERNALLYAPIEDLKTIRDRIQERINQEKLKLSPLYTDLFGEEEEEEETEKLSFEDLEEKYKPTDEKRYYVNPDKTILVLNIYPKGSNTDVAFARKLYNDVKARVEATEPPSGIMISYGGNFKNKIDEYAVIMRDVRGTAAIGLSLVFLSIVLYFRRIMAGVFVAIPLVVALALTFGITQLVIGQLNTFTVFLFVILFGLGIDFGIHILARYTEERRRAAGYRDALVETVRGSGRALVTAAVTTSAAFYTLIFTDFRGFSEFGFIAGTGVLFSLIAMVLVLPSIIALAEKLHLFRIKPKSTYKTDFRGRRYPFARTVLVVGLGFALFSIYGLSQIRFEYDFSNLRANLPETSIVKKKLSQIFKESDSPAIVMAESREALEEITRALDEKIANDPTPTIDKYRTIYDLLPDNQEEKLKLIAEIRSLINRDEVKLLSKDEREKVERLRELADVRPLTIDDLPYEIKRPFLGKDGQVVNFALIYPSILLRFADKAIEFADDVRDIRTASGKVYHASGPAIVRTDMLLTMLREGEIAVGAVLGAVFLLVFLDMRSLTRTLLVLTPLIVGLLWMLGMMYLLGWKLNIFNMVVIPSVLGMGVDSGVHIFHRYRHEGPGSIVKVVRYTGGAVAIATVTTMVGFSGLVLAYHPGLKAIGSLALIGLGCTVISALTVLPALLQVLEDRKAKRAARAEAVPKKKADQAPIPIAGK
jgi:predicted RND superfamily exporter protein